MRARIAIVVGVLLLSGPAPFVLQAYAQTNDFEYFAANRVMIRNGVQAVLLCNGLFTSNRSLQQVFAQELAYLSEPIGDAQGGDYQIDWRAKAVSVGGGRTGPIMRAAYRAGLGCVVMAPNQGFDDIDSLPSLELPVAAAAAANDAASIEWPQGDLVGPQALSSDIDTMALQAASSWAFNRDTPQQDTISLLVVHRGQIVHERYAEGFDMTTRTRTWSTAKSIGATLIGLLVEANQLSLDGPLALDWLPALAASDQDPRHAITLRHLLNMSSGLDPVDSFGREYITGSGLAYWAGASSVDGARRRGLIRRPGTFWDYENYDTLLATYALKRALATSPGSSYLHFPRTGLFDRIGMHSTLVSTDRFGDFIFSSQVYSNARDLARFGLLYLQQGVWQGKRLLSQAWIDFVRTPAPATESRGNDYGGHFWLVPAHRTDVPTSAYATAGNRGQYVVVVPSHDLVIVRRGLDYGRQGFDRWDLTREVLKAFVPVATNE